ncbi:hypothetical protein QFC19_006307 [Naganishia cerealis]|uniref:Uncharacterized protein n=1 Tax=Naganishia cerealis TaxID=610337 RepID=A0ACC2VHA1_9TREE|nr:hypothetical protein QFC19_006307 [Naganishia cerealis]
MATQLKVQSDHKIDQGLGEMTPVQASLSGYIGRPDDEGPSQSFLTALPVGSPIPISGTAGPSTLKHSSPSSSVQPGSSPKTFRANSSSTVRLIDDLPRAEHQAYNTFQVLDENVFVQKKIGFSHQSLDMMVCECQYDPCSDDPGRACGAEANCINRLTQVECLPQECPSKHACQNQRFARRQYPDIEIVQTENKGFGLRAGGDLAADAFVYEYIGEVIPETLFRKRIRQYADEGIQHFYFMMLQKGEYIDATRKGGIARFLNHSCNPNCYVAKWVVGQHMRMGIFTKREIRKGEELTFNYNVDRYGYDAQICHCGELNCLGTIGGKTQTDIGAMDDLYIDALGITEDVNLLHLRGSKRQDASKLGKDYNVSAKEINLSIGFALQVADPAHIQPILRPMEESEATKVVTAVRQAVNQSNKTIIVKLLERIKITEAPEVHREILRLKGHAMIRYVLEMADIDEAILHLALEAADKWQPRYRNGIQDSGLPDTIEKISLDRNEAIQSLAHSLISRWAQLPFHYVLPARSESSKLERLQEHDEIDIKPRWSEETRPIEFCPAPVIRPAFPAKIVTQESSPPLLGKAKVPVHDVVDQQAKLESILAAAKEDLVSGKESDSFKTQDDHDQTLRSLKGERNHRDRSRKKQRFTASEMKDRHLKMLIVELVTQVMSKYKQQINDRDTFKKHAKESGQAPELLPPASVVVFHSD